MHTSRHHCNMSTKLVEESFILQNFRFPTWLNLLSADTMEPWETVHESSNRYMHSDLHSELRHLKVARFGFARIPCTATLLGALFKPFKDKFRFHILVDCGGIQPASMTDYGRNLSQIYHSTLHAKLILIKSHFVRNHNSLAYFLTGNIRQSLVNDELLH